MQSSRCVSRDIAIVNESSEELPMRSKLASTVNNLFEPVSILKCLRGSKSKDSNDFEFLVHPNDNFKSEVVRHCNQADINH